MQVDSFARGFAKSLVLGSIKKELGPFLQPFKPRQIEWLIKNNKNITDFLPQNIAADEGNKRRYSGLSKFLTEEELFKILSDLRPDIARVIQSNNAMPWFKTQMELLKRKLL